MGHMKRFLLGMAAAVVLAGVVIVSIFGIGRLTAVDSAHKTCNAQRAELARTDLGRRPIATPPGAYHACLRAAHNG